MKKKEQGTVTEQPEQPNVEGSEVETPATDEQQSATEQPEQQNTDDQRIDAILKLYPQYEKVYIDSHGFVFTVDTPKDQRNDAVLYKNKYHKK